MLYPGYLIYLPYLACLYNSKGIYSQCRRKKERERKSMLKCKHDYNFIAMLKFVYLKK